MWCAQLQIYRWLLLARIIISWVNPNPYYHPAIRAIYDLTEPALRPCRSLLPAYHGIDFSPMIASSWESWSGWSLASFSASSINLLRGNLFNREQLLEPFVGEDRRSPHLGPGGTLIATTDRSMAIS